MSERSCSVCGRKLKPNARFCSFCGSALGEMQTRSTAAPTSQVRRPSPPPPPAKPAPPPVEPMPAEIEAAMILRGSLQSLQTEKASVDEQLETVRVKQMVGEIPESEAEKALAPLQSRLDSLVKEIEEKEVKAHTPLDTLEQEHRAQQQRLEKLEALRKSDEVDEAIYARLAAEYRTKLTEAGRQAEAERAKLQLWLSQYESQQRNLEFEKETLQVRARIDDLSKREVAKQLKTLDGELTRVADIVKGLRSVVGVPPSVQDTGRPGAARKGKANKCPHCGATIASDSKWCLACGRLLVE
jgi:predicted nucleic acid-binding Zn ribbon protein